MNSNALKQEILSLTQDIMFTYKGKPGSICPFSRHDIALTYGDKTKDYTDIDKLMSDPFFEGKSLEQISEQLDID